MQVLVNPEGGLANPLSINNRDWVAGAINPSDDIIGHPGLWRRNADSQSGKPSWRMTDLGTLGGANAEVHSPNKNEIGWLAGNSDTATTDLKGENFCGWVCAGHGCPTTINVCQGFLWRQETNKMIALPPITPVSRCNSPLNGGCNSFANAANNNHQIAGIAENGIMEPSVPGCIQLPGQPQVFLYNGVVWSLDASGAPFIQRTLPPVKGDVESQAIGMNDAGIVVGASGACAPPGTLISGMHAVLWKNNGPPLVLANNLRGTGAAAGAINENGQVVGVTFLPPPNDAVIHPFLWQDGVGMKDLGSLLPDDTLVFPDSINNRGEVVGWSCGPHETETPFSCGPFYWREGMKQPIDLNQLTQSPHLGICCASDINDSGEIVVAVFDPSYNGGDIRAAVLVPQQGGPSTAENLAVQNAAAVQRSVLPSNVLQHLKPRFLGLKIAR
jgi:probable HAF family extracellular repeat protein